MVKPRIFITSSRENIGIVDAIQINLDHDAEIVPWTLAFEPSSNTIETLLDYCSSVDFAIFAFSPDDVLHMRNTENSVVRDNVILEFGLFTGAIGIKRCFIVAPRGRNIHLPTDVLGITLLDYDSGRSDNNVAAALNFPCAHIKQAVNRLGRISKRQNLTTAELATLQHAGLKEVWVYAPNPLEAISSGDHIELRRQVFKNIVAGVKYIYFVESEEGINRIIKLANRMLEEAKHLGGAPTVSQDEIASRISIVRLTPCHFLTHFTIHINHTGEIEVLQSTVMADRNDNLERLGGVRAEEVRKLIDQQISTMQSSDLDGFTVFRFA